MKTIFKNVSSIKLVTALAFSCSMSFAHAGAVVVVGASSLIQASSKSDVVKVFLGKKKSLPGSVAIPIDQETGNSARTDFYGNTVKKTDAQLKSYWSRLIFTGKGQAPQVVGNDNDIKSMVANNPNLIGYIEESAVDGTVKVIYKP
jgi:hypothetical protein